MTEDGKNLSMPNAFDSDLRYGTRSVEGAKRLGVHIRNRRTAAKRTLVTGCW
jgi:hypothetical protein